MRGNGEAMQTFQIHTKEKREATGDLFGIFFEDINHAADGGLYAELIQNRAFEFDPIDNKKYHALVGTVYARWTSDFRECQIDRFDRKPIYTEKSALSSHDSEKSVCRCAKCWF